MAGQFPIVGKQYKHFDDGVDIAVDYTRHDLNVTHINSVRYSYNLEYMDIDYDCSYTDFIHSHPKVRISKNMIDVGPRVRQMMDELESELRSELRSARDEQDRLEAIESELGFTIPRPNRIGVADAINLDGSINLQAIGIKSEPNPPPAPIRKLTRWELLELD